MASILKKSFIYFLILFGANLLLSDIAHANQFISCAHALEADFENQAPRWFEDIKEAFRKRGRKVQSEVTVDDIRLMQNSFANKVKRQPVEYGLIEVLDENNRLLYSSGYIRGEVAQIRLGYQFTEAMEFARRYKSSSKIRMTHTHPPALQGHHTVYITNVFSEADLAVDRDRRTKLDNYGLAHIDLELKIIFIDPKYTEFTTDDATMTQILRSRAYMLPGLY